MLDVTVLNGTMEQKEISKMMVDYAKDASKGNH